MDLKFAMRLLFVCLLLLLSWTGGEGQFVHDEMPKEITECLSAVTNGTADSISHELAEASHAHCLQMFLWKFQEIPWNDFNITDEGKEYINYLISSMVHRGRQNNQDEINPGGPRLFPKTGYRIRREYRRLSDAERFAFHSALNTLKMTGRYDAFASLHRGIVVVTVHDGPNFLGWHRVFLALFEEALRTINPKLSLPYWDSSMDFEMDDPRTSIIWTPPFAGNGVGPVVTGPFAYWPTAMGPLERHIGEDGKLISKPLIWSVLSRCLLGEITAPAAPDHFNLELAHKAVHVWVGGQMSGLNVAAHDPLFFLHHAFIDYIWELFRIRQATVCGVNPATDYPPIRGPHFAMRRMTGLPDYRNIEGIQAYWTQFWYGYEPTPTCSAAKPYCGTPYLRCDVKREICVSVSVVPPPLITGGTIW